MTLKRYTEPAELPLTLDQAKLHLKIDDDIGDAELDEDVLDLVRDATAHIEGVLGRVLITQVWQNRIDRFPCAGGAIELALPPVISVDRVDYIDVDGETRTLAPQCYELDAQSETAWLVPAYGYVWPEARDQVNAITVTFTAGYGGAAMVPSDIRRALKLLIRHWFDNPSAVNVGGIVTDMPQGVDLLLYKHRVMRFA